MNSGPQLVVVDGVPETAQVLRAVFEPRGYHVNRVRAFELPRLPHDRQSVFVMHGDGNNDDHQASDVDDRTESRLPRVIIGSLAAAADSETVPIGDHRLSQPFHYAELIRAVEALLVDPS